MAGEILDPAWRLHNSIRDNSRRDAFRIFGPSGTPCSATGCHQCTDSSCPYADFIRRYWNHPWCD